MRRAPILAAVAAVVLLLAADTVAVGAPGRGHGYGRDEPPRGRPQAPADAPLRLNDVQARGTHNSYHLNPHHPFGDAAGWGYSHPTLSEQLEDGDVRQVEIDIHYNWARDDFEVYHAWLGDDRSTCDLLRECLAEIRAWSDAHPSHHPVMILIEPKDAGPPYTADLPEDGDPFTRPFGLREYAALDALLLDAFTEDGGGDRVVTPDDVRGAAATLQQAIRTGGWPAIDEVRQHVLFVVDGDDHAERYSGGWLSLAGRAMFVQAAPTDPVAAFVSRSATAREGAPPGEGRHDRMARLVAEGFMVRDLVGPGAFEASKAAGAHFISSDDPHLLTLSGDPQAPSRCNPVTTAGRPCDDRSLEVHDGHHAPPYAPRPSPPDDPVAAREQDVARVVEAVESTGACAADPAACVARLPATGG